MNTIREAVEEARAFYSGREEHGLEADPLLIDPEASLPDLHLSGNSLALNRALNLYPSLPDLPLVEDGKPDIGAYEYGSSFEPGAQTSPIMKQEYGGAPPPMETGYRIISTLRGGMVDWACGGNLFIFESREGGERKAPLNVEAPMGPEPLES